MGGVLTYCTNIEYRFPVAYDLYPNWTIKTSLLMVDTILRGGNIGGGNT